MALLDFLFPRCCLGCGEWGRYFCEDCLKDIKPIERQICPVCGKPAISGKTHSRCQTRYSLDGLISIFAYEGVIKEAITKLKYKFVTDLAKELIDLTASYLRTQISNSSFLIHNSFTSIPVPLHPRRQRWRGFNQAELLGNKLAEKFGWQVRADVLIRQKHTKPQTKLKGKERKENIKGAFKINPKITYNLKPTTYYLIFDDVWTTGSTLRECGNVLKRARIKQVWGLTLAR